MSIGDALRRDFGSPARADDLDAIAVISRAIFEENRRPTFIYRQAPIRAHDSGWALTLGETFPSDTTQPHPPLETAHLRHLAERWPELRLVFADRRPASSWEWDESASAYREAQGSSWTVWREPPCVDMGDRSAVARDLARHIREFLDGYKVVSPAVVSHMEALVHAFPDCEWSDALNVPLASYEPWGSDDGRAYYTTEELGRVLTSVLPAVEAEVSRDIQRR
jgi:hypothetical protein